MENFQFYKAKEVYREKYYQLPKVFFTNDKYKGLSNDAKIAYTLLKDRFDYSIQNNWIDEEGNIYFIFTVQELMCMLNCREGKINKIKKELTESGLLYQKRAGFKIKNGQQVNQPNYMYLGKPEITSEDVFLITNDERNGIAKIANPQESQEERISSGIAKIANPLEISNTNEFNGIAKIANNLFNSSSLDTLDTLDTTKEKIQQQQLLDHFSEIQDQSFLDKRCLELIALFSSSIQEATDTIGIIIRAKNKQEKKYGRVLIAEDWQEEIEHTLRKVYHKIKTDSTIKNRDNYMFGAFCTTFNHCFLELSAWENKQKKDTPVISTYDWVEQRENK